MQLSLSLFWCRRSTSKHCARFVKPIVASCLKLSSSCAGSPGVGNQRLRALPTASFAKLTKSGSAEKPAGDASAVRVCLAPPLDELLERKPKCPRKVVQSKRAPASARPVRPWNTSTTSFAAWSLGSNLPRSRCVRSPSSSLSASSKASRSVPSNSAPPRSMHAATNSVQPMLPSPSKSMASAAFPACAASAPMRRSASATAVRSTRPWPARLKASNHRFTLGHWFAGQRLARDKATLL
mmetsp:Transcript_7269/g.20633  ORF Transcript_7269/g.20633 Transcript_7269/m.20633 type:complete len:239 (+) Transcript_7269:118-834(+)